MAVILVVEDDVFIRLTAELVIRDSGHQILSASDVEEALLILRSPQHIDALFTDIISRRPSWAGAILRARRSNFDRNCVCFTRPEISSPTL